MKNFLLISMFAALLAVGCDEIPGLDDDDNLPPTEQTPDGDNNKPDNGDENDDPTNPDNGDENDDPADAPDTIPNDEIWYTTSDGEIVKPYYSYFGEGVKIVSNTNENGIGIIKFSAPATTIGDGAFSGCSSLTSINIPDSVTTIGYQAFYGCYSLTSVTIGNGVTTIGVGAFSGCSSLTSVTIPDSVTFIGGGAFIGCSSLTSVTIPDSVTTIGVEAFAGCSSLTAFYGKFASADNSYLIVDGTLKAFAPAGLTEYTIPDSVTTIGDGAFDGCSSLTSVTIGNGVTTIGELAFYNCSSLTSVTIPDSVTTIGDGAFFSCSSLISVYCKPTTPPYLYTPIFDGIPTDAKIYVPRVSVEAYKMANYWSKYADMIVGYDF